jgi:hypothetical protein
MLRDKNIYISKYALKSLVYTLAVTDFFTGTVRENNGLLKTASYGQAPRK